MQTLVSVPSGRTMVMGGLISDTKSNSSAGLPLVSRIPILGGLFGTQGLKNNRTELVLFITPRVVDSEQDNEAILNDLRRRMQNLDRVFPGTSSWPASPPTYSDQIQRCSTRRSTTCRGRAGRVRPCRRPDSPRRRLRPARGRPLPRPFPGRRSRDRDLARAQAGGPREPAVDAHTGQRDAPAADGTAPPAPPPSPSPSSK